MSTPRYDSVPPNAASLRQRIKNTYQIDETLMRRRTRTMANIAVAQMLPDSTVKGGTSLNIRRGPDASRFSLDLDVTRPIGVSESDFIDELETNLKSGWNGFAGTLIRKEKAKPINVPVQYVMRPVDINLTYNGSTFERVKLELARDELGGPAHVTEIIASELVDLFTSVGLAAPSPVAVSSIEHQVVQKLHACTTLDSRGANERAHDLVDIQLLCDGEDVDLSEMDTFGRRLFAFRAAGEWPPTVIARTGWDALYAEASEGLNVRPLTDAITWTNQLVTAAATGGQIVP